MISFRQIWFVNSLTNEISRVEQGAVSVNDVIRDEQIAIYPNPSNGKVILESYDLLLDGFTAEVRDIFGKIVYRSETLSTQRQTLHLRNLASGVYSISLKKDGVNALAKKVIIQK